jgi:hypothetical protein
MGFLFVWRGSGKILRPRRKFMVKKTFVVAAVAPLLPKFIP